MILDNHLLKLAKLIFLMDVSNIAAQSTDHRRPGFSQLLMTKGSLSFVLELIQPSTPGTGPGSITNN